MRVPGFDNKQTTVETATGAQVTGTDIGGASTVRPVGSVDAASDAATTRAYEQGRADALHTDRERDRIAADRVKDKPRRRGFPLLSLIVLILALIGAAWIVLSIMQGSAAGGGAAVDNKLSAVTQPARDAVSNVRNSTGQAVENAGEALKNSGEKIKQP